MKIRSISLKRWSGLSTLPKNRPKIIIFETNSLPSTINQFQTGSVTWDQTNAAQVSLFSATCFLVSPTLWLLIISTQGRQTSQLFTSDDLKYYSFIYLICNSRWCRHFNFWNSHQNCQCPWITTSQKMTTIIAPAKSIGTKNLVKNETLLWFRFKFELLTL